MTTASSPGLVDWSIPGYLQCSPYRKLCKWRWTVSDREKRMTFLTANVLIVAFGIKLVQRYGVNGAAREPLCLGQLNHTFGRCGFHSTCKIYRHSGHKSGKKRWLLDKKSWSSKGLEDTTKFHYARIILKNADNYWRGHTRQTSSGVQVPEWHHFSGSKYPKRFMRDFSRKILNAKKRHFTTENIPEYDG